MEIDVDKKLSMKECTRSGEIAVEMVWVHDLHELNTTDKRLINKEQ